MNRHCHSELMSRWSRQRGRMPSVRQRRFRAQASNGRRVTMPSPAITGQKVGPCAGHIIILPRIADTIFSMPRHQATPPLQTIAIASDIARSTAPCRAPRWPHGRFRRSDESQSDVASLAEKRHASRRFRPLFESFSTPRHCLMRQPSPLLKRSLMPARHRSRPAQHGAAAPSSGKLLGPHQHSRAFKPSSPILVADTTSRNDFSR